MDFEFNWVSFLLVIVTIVFLFRINIRKQDSQQAEKDERMFRPQPFKNSKPADNVPKSTIGRRSPSYRATSRRSTVHDNDYDCRPTGIFGGDDSPGGGGFGGDCGGGGGGGGGGDCGGGGGE